MQTSYESLCKAFCDPALILLTAHLLSRDCDCVFLFFFFFHLCFLIGKQFHLRFPYAPHNTPLELLTLTYLLGLILNFGFF